MGSQSKANAARRGERGIGRELSIVAFAAALARIAHSMAMGNRAIEEILYLNPARYDAWARMILDGVGPAAPWEQAPGYAYFLSWIYAIAGPQPQAALAVQLLLSVLTCGFLCLAAHHLAGRRAALATGLLASFYGPFIYFQAELLPETLLLFLIGAALAAVMRPSPSWVAAGMLWAAAYLVRSNVVLAMPFVILHAWQSGGRRAALRSALPFVVVAAALFAVNTAGSGTTVVSTTSGGVNLWLGNNPTADGVNPFFGPDQAAAETRVRSEATTAVEADRLFRTMAGEFWRSQPGDALALVGKKLVWTFTARELPNNVDIEWRRTRSPVFALPLLPFGFGIILLLAAIGAVANPPRRGAMLALLAPAALALGTCVVFFTNARFRIPLAMPLLILAGAGIAAWLPPAQARALLRTMAPRAAVAAAFAAALAWGNWFGVRDYRIAQIDVNTGITARMTGDLETAVRFLRLGVEREPRDVVGWVHLGRVYEQLGDDEAAQEAFAAAARAGLPE